MIRTMRNLAGLISLFGVPALAWAQLPADTAGGVARREMDLQQSREFESRLRMRRSKPEETPQSNAVEEQGPKVRIAEIRVEGASVLESGPIEKVVAPYRGQELSISQMQNIADEITAIYRGLGYVTSRAYIPPQNLREGVLTIKIVEGKMGQVDVKGNRYFSSKIYRQYLQVNSQTFDYPEVQKGLTSLNEHPDRKVKAVLVPGSKPGETDIILEVEERLPFHVGFEFDNWASRYLNNYRYAVTFEHNNITGHDDRALFKFQTSDGLNLRLYQGRYLYPLTRRTTAGVYGLVVDTELGRELGALDAHGRGTIYGGFYSYELLKEHDIEAHFNLGFDSKDIRNFALGARTSRDELSIFKVGLNFDVLDEWGRNIVVAQLDAGAPNTFGSMDAKDSQASRQGSGAKFQKGVFTYYRLQPMPWESHILLKNNAQFSNHALPASEQFQIGGPTSVRGYAPGEVSGDKGIYSSLEWSFPVYGLSKNLRVPYTRTSFYDAVRLVAFYDLGYVNIKNTASGEQENNTLKGYGFGVRFNPNSDVEVRFEAGIPAGSRRSVDGNGTHYWIEAKIKF